MYQENRLYVEKINELVVDTEKLQENIKSVKKSGKEQLAQKEQEMSKEIAMYLEEKKYFKNEIKQKFLDRLASHEQTLDILTEEMEELCMMINQVQGQNVMIMYESQSSFDVNGEGSNLNSRGSLNVKPKKDDSNKGNN